MSGNEIGMNLFAKTTNLLNYGNYKHNCQIALWEIGCIY
jgi:hypothetical protein